jgi:hypothetical protein
MALVGVASDDVARLDAIVPTLDRTLQVLAEHTESTTSTALRGTALWALTLAQDGRAEATLRVLEHEQRLKYAASWELGLVLSGLSSVIESGREQHRDRALKLASGCVHELRSRFSSRGRLFRAHGRVRRPTAILERNFTSFADQAYPLHGLAVHSRATDASLGSEAVIAAERIVEQQGTKGQWWWLYSAANGNVVEPYPVFSVHQDGMAFMALVPLREIVGTDFAVPLANGVKWLHDNEVGQSLVDSEHGFIDRCIQRSGSDPDGRHGVSRGNRRAAVARSLWRAPARLRDHDPSGLEILHECRPYHLGWVLYARSLVRQVQPNC